MKHVFFECEQPCEKPYCQYCQGGLAFCTVCKKGEAELADECPGYEIKGYPHVKNIAVGDEMETKIGDEWRPVTITWIGDLVVYGFEEATGERHKIHRFYSTLREKL